MASGLLALLDDITALTDDIATLADDVVALSDDVATLTVAAGKKATGVVTDDMAVTAEQTVGVASDRELPVVWKVARGSLFNKFVILCPAALALDWVAPWAILPILMAGGLYLSFEGVEKVVHKFWPHDAHDGGAPKKDALRRTDPAAYEKKRVAGAIRTDMILSAEIVAITLGTAQDAEFLVKAGVLYAISLAVTVGVYGLVALLVRLDDIGLAMVARGGSSALVGKRIVAGVPYLMATISWVGTVAMLIVGGHILLEGIPPIEHAAHDLLHAVPHAAELVLAPILDALVGAVFGSVVVAAMAVWARVSGRPDAPAH